MTTLFPQELQVLAYSSTITARSQIFLSFKFSPNESRPTSNFRCQSGTNFYLIQIPGVEIYGLPEYRNTIDLNLTLRPISSTR